MQRGGCWIFLSHSSHDIQKVRIIRNEFEKYSHNFLGTLAVELKPEYFADEEQLSGTLEIGDITIK